MTARGRIHDVRVLPWHVAPLTAHMIEKIPPDLSKYLICPMPGLLVALHVGEGDKVEAGQPLATVEAMKMENILRAEKAGAVKTVNAAQGDSLAVDAVILELEYHARHSEESEAGGRGDQKTASPTRRG